jgi:amidase
MDGQVSMPSVMGPLSASLSALSLFGEAISNQKPWELDPACVRLPWTKPGPEITEGKLCFGILRKNDVVTPWPSVSKAINATVAALVKEGHEVIEWDPPAASRAVKIVRGIFGADAGADVYRDIALSGEPQIPQLNLFLPKEVGVGLTAVEWAALNLEKRKSVTGSSLFNRFLTVISRI